MFEVFQLVKSLIFETVNLWNRTWDGFQKKQKQKKNGATFGLNYIYLRLVECNSRRKRNFI